MTIGHKWLFETLQTRPSIGWHIDPFGHQSTNAALFSQMGFNAWFFARIDY
jgi:lysosomal alpha-mannosidase